MKNLIVHDATRIHIENIQKDLPQSLLLSGEYGVGLKTIAKAIAGKDLAAIIQPQDKKEAIDPENGTITVEIIRRLYDQTRSKRTSAQVIVIDNADRMSRGAANAFLKLLEEPSQHVHFILTSHEPQNLLPTIRSRVQQVTIQPVSHSQTSDYIAGLGISDATKLRQLEFIASGLPAELFRLATNDEYFSERAKLMADARDFLMADTYKKITIVQKYQSDRSRALLLIDSALVIARRSVSAKPQQSLIRQLGQLLAVREHIAANYNVKLQLTQFVL